MTITLVLGSDGTIGGDTEETYVLTIPDSLTITQDGWNAFSGGIHAQANSEASTTFSGTLTVTAASSYDWQLVLSPDKSDTISFTYESDNTATFTYNNGSFTETHSGDFIYGTRMNITDGKLVAEFDGFDGNFSDDFVDTLTLNPADNTWTLSKGESTYETSDHTFAVNGTDITTTLKQN